MTEALLAILLSWAVQLSGYPAPPDGLAPPVVTVPQAELAAAYCPANPSRCGAVAVYLPPGDGAAPAARLAAAHGAPGVGEGVLIVGDSLDLPATGAASIIVHELVHWLQWRAGRYAGLDALAQNPGAHCRAVLALERQAYAVQRAYLAAYGRPGYLLGAGMLRCPEEETHE